MKNNYVSVWGLDGASKTTSIQHVASVFEKNGYPTTITRKPGGTPLAEEVRNLHKRTWDERVTPFSELMLMMTTFNQLSENVIVPSLNKGNSVIEDRGWGCTFAYQIFERQPELESTFFSLIAGAYQHVLPEKILFLDVEPEEGLRRSSRRGALDRLEQQHIDFFYRARRGYQELARRFPDQIHTVDANEDVESVQKSVTAWANSVIK